MAEKEAWLKSGGAGGDGGKDKPEPLQIQSSAHSVGSEEMLALQHTIATLESNIAELTNKSKNDDAELTALREQKDKYSNMNNNDQGEADAVAVEVDNTSSKEIVELRERLALKEERLVRIVLGMFCRDISHIYLLTYVCLERVDKRIGGTGQSAHSSQGISSGPAAVARWPQGGEGGQ